MTSKVVVIMLGDQEILIDRKDLKGVDLSNLRITSHGYVAIGKKYLHRVIMKPLPDMQVDHANKNTLDNRRCNLRICTPSQNLMNRGKSRGNTTGRKGVNKDKRRQRKSYRARITANKKTFNLGYFEELDEAGAAYEKGAKKHHGKFARIN
jgi:hypothetical protein